MATNKEKNALRDLDDLQSKMADVSSMLLAIHEGMYYGQSNAKSYCGAVLAACDYLERLCDDMKMLIEWGRD